MSFLYPSFFWALGVLSIPIIIHLFNFKRTTRVFFSNTRFLRKVKESTTAKRKLKHYLILLSRLLFLFFLVITFCQPFLPASEETINHHNVVFYLDNSQSMSVPGSGQKKNVDHGVAFIRSILSTFPADARYKLVTNDFAPFSNTYKSRREIEELLTQLRLSPVSRSMSEILLRVAQSNQSSPEIFYISDFQRSTTGLINRKLLTDSLTRLHLVPVTSGKTTNVFVDSVFLDNPFAVGGERNALRVRLRNEGTQPVDQLPVKLIINSFQAGTANVTIPAGGIVEAGFDLTTGLGDLNKAEISFADFPVAFDNQFFVALNFGEKIRVVEIRGNAGATPVEKVFGNASVFQYSGYDVSNFNYNTLRNADLAVVNGLNSIPEGLITALQEFNSTGKTMLIAPGTRADISSYQRLVSALPITAATDATMAELDRPDFANPFFENVFEEKSTSIIMPKATSVLQWRTDGNAILKFRNGKPFLSRVDQGGGIYLLASPLENTFTEFYNNAIFVPVMYRIAASSKHETNSLYHTLNDNFISFRMDSFNSAAQLRLIREEEIIPEQRIVGDRVMMDLPKFTMNQGFYKVVGGSDTLSLLAFNLDKKESLLDPMPPRDVKASLGDSKQVTIFESGTSDTFSNEIKERYLGTPLWKYSLILALVFIAMEIALIRFMK